MTTPRRLGLLTSSHSPPAAATHSPPISIRWSVTVRSALTTLILISRLFAADMDQEGSGDCRLPSKSLTSDALSRAPQPNSLMVLRYSTTRCANGRSGAVLSPAATASPTSLRIRSIAKPPWKSLLTAAVSTTPSTGYQLRSAQLSPDETEAI